MPDTFTIAALYKFVHLADYRALQPVLLRVCQDNDIRGTLLLAEEGINGTVAGTSGNIERLFRFFRRQPQLADMDYKLSYSAEVPFHRIRVKLRKEIVSLGVPGISPLTGSAIRVDPGDWNRLISDPGTLLVDTRNHYEYRIGTFKDALSPGTTNFREFPEYVRTRLAPRKHKKIALFCTGGIRCEKAGAYMLGQGFENVWQLNGGILKYLEEVDRDDSLWRGECFVFDGRVSVDHDLEEGRYEQCFACRRPVSGQDMRSPDYQRGVSCSHCISETTASQRAAFSERQRQVELAEQRNEKHIGARM